MVKYKIITVVFAALLALFLASCGEDTYTPPETTETAETKAQTTIETTEQTAAYDGGFSVFLNGISVFDLNTKDAAPVKVDGKAEIIVKTGEIEGEITLFVHTNGETVRLDAFDASPRSERVLSADCQGETSVSVMIKQGSETAIYAAGSEMLKYAQDENAILIMTADMETEGDTVISKPFTWRTNGHAYKTKRLVFESETDGRMVIENEPGIIICTETVCETENWDYVINSEFSDFAQAGRFNVRAKTVNGREIDNTALYVDGAEKAEALISSGGRQLTGVRKLYLTGEFAFPRLELDLSGLVIKGNVSLPDGFVIKTDGDIKIDTTENETALADFIRVDAPGSALIWDGGDAPDAEYADKYLNVREYNGYELDGLTGGKSGLTLGDCNIDGIAGKTDGYSVNFELPYHIKEFNINSTLDASAADGCTAGLVEDGGRLYVVVSDGEGTCGYAVNITHPGYNLARIYITTENGREVTSKETYINCAVTVDYNGVDGSEDFDRIDELDAMIRGRGHSSWKLDKKPYRIKFTEKTSLFGLTAAKKWVLQANHADKSLMRNTLAMRMGACLTNMPFVPHSYLVDVFVNGQYMGVYSLTEQVEIKAGRIAGESNSEEVDTDYLLELGEEAEKTSFGTNRFSSELTRFAQIKNPDKDVLSKAQYDFIYDYVRRADKAVKNSDGYEDYIDVDSLIDWFILHELTYNLDCSFRRSVFILKKSGGKLYMACPWDFDYAFCNFYLDPDPGDITGWICLGSDRTDDYDNYIQTNWMDYLLKDKAFLSKLKARWNEVKEDIYKTAFEATDELEAACAPSATENYTVWKNVLGNKIQYEKRSTAKIDTYAGNVQFLRDFIKERYAWMDKEINKA